ncbi:Ger(x)C family spore germination protein [Oscillospiraceae bacterium OttesenSCG-928-G22]|nr:Ger(x)C family spore germination protein [Oscillospiraceae bacterium OttesenSCG-928-G22]
MNRRAFIAGLLLLPLFFMAGCWDYKGLDELSVVAGIAIDKSEKEGMQYTLSFEIIDASASKEQGAQRSILVTSDGRTVYEAVDNAKKQLYNDLYFGNTEIFVISETLAREEGIKGLMESFFRDPDVRDIMILVVSRQETAKELITPDEESPMILSYELYKAINRDMETTYSTKTTPFYHIYNVLERGTSSLVLPAYFFDEEAAIPQPKAGGLAVFEGDMLSGFLEDENVPYYLYFVEPLTDGTFSYYVEDDPKKDVTLSLSKTTPKMGYRYEEGELTLTLHLAVVGYTRELSVRANEVDPKEIARIQQTTAEQLKEKLEETLAYSQEELSLDIFGYGTTIYRKNPSLWREIEANYIELYKNAKHEIAVSVTIFNTGMIKDY